MKKFVLLFSAITIWAVPVFAQEMFVGNVTFINKGLLKSNGTVANITDSKNMIKLDSGSYWLDDSKFEVKSGTVELLGDHRVKGNLVVLDGGNYAVKYKMNKPDKDDDIWGQLIVNEGVTGSITVEKVIYGNSALSESNSFVYLSLPVSGIKASDLAKLGSKPGTFDRDHSFLWLPNKVDYISIEENDELKLGTPSLLYFGPKGVLLFNEVIKFKGIPNNDNITEFLVWPTNHRNNMSGVLFDRNNYMRRSKDGTGWDGWNVIGNPYTAAISLEKLLAEAAQNSVIDPTVYTYKRSYLSGKVTSSPGTYNVVTGASSTEDKYILPFESFQVKSAKIDEINNSTPEANVPVLDIDVEEDLVFLNPSTFEERNADNGPNFELKDRSFETIQNFFLQEIKFDNKGKDVLRLDIYSNNILVDYAFVAYTNGIGKKFRDTFDSTQPITDGKPYVFSKSSGSDKFNYNYLHNISDDEIGQVVPLRIITAGLSNLKLRLKYQESTLKRVIYLEDKLKKTITKINPSDTVFVNISDATAKQNLDRFFLHYGKKPQIDKPEDGTKIIVSRSDRGNRLYLYIKTDQKSLNFSVFTTSGKRVRRVGSRIISKLVSRKVGNVEHKYIKINLSNRYKKLPLIVKAYNDQISHEQIVLAK